MTDIYGQWVLTAQALNQDGSVLYDWAARVRIDPEDGDRVQVTVDSEGGKSSRAVSTGAQLRAMPDGRSTLLYDYVADPAHEATANHDFFGLVRYVFEPDGQSAQGHYLNYNSRYTFGKLALTRAARD
ncbi:Cap15 family cyclic dinucleotide receptor domain-containing protein [Sphingobium sp. HWE2-09]|uniref:Cap15 family cyclic dinucleotide receptor domain-containing protein n=1 Tax=Sphingobium sp. HWE2-09 TaxID=3108390 RepID=UPI002DC773D3|nr:hypothetical protein [Sphingobium sp. HWE2-09]